MWCARVERSLKSLGHEVLHLRDALPIRTDDSLVLRFAFEHGNVLITCNWEDFIEHAGNVPHVGIILVFRRKTRAGERAALKLLDQAGEAGIAGNINFALSGFTKLLRAPAFSGEGGKRYSTSS